MCDDINITDEDYYELKEGEFYCPFPFDGICRKGKKCENCPDLLYFNETIEKKYGYKC